MRNAVRYEEVLRNIKEAAENGAAFTKSYIESHMFGCIVDLSRRYDVEKGRLVLYTDIRVDSDTYISVAFVRVSRNPELFSVHYIDAPYAHLEHCEYYEEVSGC